MKSGLFYMLILFSSPFVAGAQVKTVYLTSFGAKAGDNVSDQSAFDKAASYINARKGNTRLIIPGGKYIAGPNDKAIVTGRVNDAMRLEGCSNVVIEGKGKVQIRFIDGLPYGTSRNVFPGKDSAVHIGALFRLINCTNIGIVNIAADGNSQKFNLLKTWGAGSRPYEREHEGLFILNSRNLVFKGLTLSNFGRDGAMVLQDAGLPIVENIQFSNCTFSNNGRNGFSCCAGNGYLFYNCKFINNGTGRIATNPSAGLDIEPERGAACSNGIFKKCEFSGNGGYAITSGYVTAANFVFDSCEIVGNTNYALFCASPFFSFKNSNVYGTSLFVYDADSAVAGTQVSNCRFYDSASAKGYYINNYIVGVTGRYLRFSGCTFTGYKTPLFYTEIKKKGAKDAPENTFFIKCVFNAFFKKASTWQNNAMLVSNSNFVDCTFNRKGVANFDILNDGEKNLHKKNSIIKEIKNQ